MANIKVAGRDYWYRNYRMKRSTDKKLNKIKKRVGKNWNGTFEEIIKEFNKKK